jgi:molybdopterin synthase catalytic subunit
LISLTRDRIDTAALLDRVTTPAAGAVVLFLGTVREMTAGRRTIALDYEAYPEMAERKMAELEAEARRRWPLVEVALVHRLGRLELAEASVAVAVSSPHRAAAFDAGRWLIDTLKEVVPVWKQENWADGTQEWVHPGMDSGAGDACATGHPKSESAHSPFPTPHSPFAEGGGA